VFGLTDTILGRVVRRLQVSRANEISAKVEAGALGLSMVVPATERSNSLSHTIGRMTV